jgi:hypothetical protein
MRGYRFPIIAAFVTCLLPALSAKAIEFAGGTGEPNDPYQIATPEQLIALALARPSGGRGDVPYVDLRSRHFALVADIDLDPCLPGGQVFSGPLLTLTIGSLDGRGRRVFNLHIRVWNRGSGGSLGADAVVRDIHFERVVVEGDASVLTATNEGYIANCSVEGISCGLLFSHVSGGRATGGGLVRENSGTISDCYSTAVVFGDSAEGGLVGANSGEISRCYATGNVTASGTADSHDCLAAATWARTPG